MPVQVRRADLYAYVIDSLERDVRSFKKALDDHAKSKGKPAPVAVHSLVEAIAASPDGAFIVDETAAEQARDKTLMITEDQFNQLVGRVSALEERAPPKGQHQEFMDRVVKLEGALFNQKLK